MRHPVNMVSGTIRSIKHKGSPKLVSSAETEVRTGSEEISCNPDFPSRAQGGESHSIWPPSVLAVTQGKPPFCCLWRLHTRAPKGLCLSSYPTRVLLLLEQKLCVLVSVFSFNMVLVLKAPAGELWLLSSGFWEQGKLLQQ